MTSLPSSYETFVDSYIGEKETLTLEDTKSTLLTRDDPQDAISSGIESQTSGLAATRSMGRGNSSKQKSNQDHKFSKSRVLNQMKFVIIVKKKIIGELSFLY